MAMIGGAFGALFNLGARSGMNEVYQQQQYYSNCTISIFDPYYSHSSMALRSGWTSYIVGHQPEVDFANANMFQTRPEVPSKTPNFDWLKGRIDAMRRHGKMT